MVHTVRAMEGTAPSTVGSMVYLSTRPIRTDGSTHHHTHPAEGSIVSYSPQGGPSEVQEVDVRGHRALGDQVHGRCQDLCVTEPHAHLERQARVINAEGQAESTQILIDRIGFDCYKNTK